MNLTVAREQSYLVRARASGVINSPEFKGTFAGVASQARQFADKHSGIGQGVSLSIFHIGPRGSKVEVGQFTEARTRAILEQADPASIWLLLALSLWPVVMSDEIQRYSLST